MCECRSTQHFLAPWPWRRGVWVAYQMKILIAQMNTWWWHFRYSKKEAQSDFPPVFWKRSTLAVGGVGWAGAGLLSTENGLVVYVWCCFWCLSFCPSTWTSQGDEGQHKFYYEWLNLSHLHMGFCRCLNHLSFTCLPCPKHDTRQHACGNQSYCLMVVTGKDLSRNSVFQRGKSSFIKKSSCKDRDLFCKLRTSHFFLFQNFIVFIFWKQYAMTT